MIKSIRTICQYLIPQQFLTAIAGALARSQKPWLKNYLIRDFLKKHPVNLSEASNPDPESYPNFNAFFTRRLKSGIRPIANDPHSIASPADGTLAQYGFIHDQTLLQAKGSYYSLDKLLGQDQTLVNTFSHGSFMTIYLAPHDYHRVHMPITGKLIKSVFIPGKLFSVNFATANLIPELYARNERLIAIYETAAGKMAMILVGAMLVGSIKPAWHDQAIRNRKREIQTFNMPLYFAKGTEMGLFEMGSTVILLFEKNMMRWSSQYSIADKILLGQHIGTVLRRPSSI